MATNPDSGGTSEASAAPAPAAETATDSDKAAAKAAAEDEEFRRKNPNAARVVGPRDGVGGS